ncbi:Uma2 family endonuclease [Streptomyces sp. NPDC001537]
MSDGFQALLDVGDELGVPRGYRVEVIRGTVVLSSWPPGHHARVMHRVCDQLKPHLPEGHVVSVGRRLYVFPSAERAYEPDIHAVHRRSYETASNRVDGETLSGRAGIPVYLLLDMQEEQATVFWSPSPQGYQGRFTKPFGEKPRIPEPFDCPLDTEGFQRPPHDEAEAPDQS